MASQSDLLLGKIAVHNKLIDKRQLQEVLQNHAGNGKHLGHVLVDLGYISKKQCDALVRATRRHMEKKGMDPSVLDGTGAGSASGSSGTTTQQRRPEPRQERAPAPEPKRDPDPAPPPADDDDEEGGFDSVKTVEYDPTPTQKRFVPELLKKARQMGASDLHLSCGASPFIRLHGRIKYFDMPALEPDFAQHALLAVVSERERRQFQKNLDLDTCISVEGVGRFRANILMQRRGVSGVFRVIKDVVPTLEDLGLPKVLERFTTYHQGIVLVTGAAGSGKSSTLAALIDKINRDRRDHIITLEDPIEYIFECKKSNVTQRQVELHTESWGKALRASLREDPDVIMVGEMRDLETVSLAITAAETGHLVLATLHTTNATRTVDRILDVFPPKEQAQIRAMVSESLRGVVSQQLVPRKDGKGRVPAVEILFWTPAVGNLIRERRTFQLFSVLQTGKNMGMRLMDDSLAKLVTQGLISREEARVRATNPNLFK